MHMHKPVCIIHIHTQTQPHTYILVYIYMPRKSLEGYEIVRVVASISVVGIAIHTLLYCLNYFYHGYVFMLQFLKPVFKSCRRGGRKGGETGREEELYPWDKLNSLPPCNQLTSASGKPPSLRRSPLLVS